MYKMQVKRQTMSFKQTKKGAFMQVDTKKQLPKLRQLAYSPEVNPLAEPRKITTKRRYVKSGRGTDLVNPSTGEVHAVASIHQVEERDDAEFVKVFAAGIKAAYELGKTAGRVFQVVLEQYEREPMSKGFADSVYLAWFDGGLSGQSIGMSEATFNRGMRELVDKGFIYPRSPSLYWTNPNLFFKGDRVMFIKEYRRRKASADFEIQADLDAKEKRLIRD
jgi:DNA-binding transcriptional regulator YhcF (GntR family)